MDEITVEIKGLREIQEKLEAMPQKIVRRSLRKAVTAGITVMGEAVKSRTPVKDGLLAESVGYTVSVLPSQQAVAGLVGFGAQGFVARMVEFGHIVKNVKKPGKMKHVPAHPFIRPAFDASREAAVEAFVETIRSEVEQDIE